MHFNKMTLGTVALLCVACDETAVGGKDASETEDTASADVGETLWTGRHYEGQGLAWASHRDLSSPEFGELFTHYRDLGWIIVDMDARPGDMETLYSMVWHENPDGRGWAEHRDLTSEEYNDFWEMYDTLGWRPLDVEAYTVGEQTRYAGIWIENVEGMRWSSRRNELSANYGDYFDDMIDSGYVPIDIEGYTDGGELKFAGIFVENIDNRDVFQRRNMSRAEYQQYVDELAADGYQITDYETYTHDGTTYYAAIWERPLQARTTVVATDRDWTSYTNTWRELSDDGYRILDQELDTVSGAARYGGIWVGNDARLDYAHKATIDGLVQQYRDDSFPEGRTGAVSVAVYHQGELVYVGGVGEADAAAGLIAHGSTVYRIASVSKAVGGTLAALLESNTQLRDGTPYSLDLTLPTRDYLPDLPDHHTHTVEQTAAHLGCVAHYGTVPAILNQSTHYETAQDAVESIWDTRLDWFFDLETEQWKLCATAEDRSYSTPSFTFLAASLEAATGRPIDQLLDEELFGPHDLSSMRSQWSDGELPVNGLRAVSYMLSGSVYTETDNTWKVLGGGIESNVVDLARFGQLNLAGAIVDAGVRDDRMWSPVDPDCEPDSDLWRCLNGLGWELRASGGRRTAEHGGSWSGARSHLRVYRDDQLVIAVLSNRTGYENDDENEVKHDPRDLIEPIASAILD